MCSIFSTIKQENSSYIQFKLINLPIYIEVILTQSKLDSRQFMVFSLKKMSCLLDNNCSIKRYYQMKWLLHFWSYVKCVFKQLFGFVAYKWRALKNMLTNVSLSEFWKRHRHNKHKNKPHTRYIGVRICITCTLGVWVWLVEAFRLHSCSLNRSANISEYNLNILFIRHKRCLNLEASHRSLAVQQPSQLNFISYSNNKSKTKDQEEIG